MNCGRSQSSTISLPDADVAKLGRSAASEITWTQFLSDCGMKAQEANEARSEKAFEDKYAGNTVFWTGTVDSTKRKPIGSGYFVNIRMDPTESAFGLYDLMLGPRQPDGQCLIAEQGPEGQFMARVLVEGGAIMGHQWDLMGIGAVRAAGPTSAPESSSAKATSVNPAPRQAWRISPSITTAITRPGGKRGRGREKGTEIIPIASLGLGPPCRELNPTDSGSTRAGVHAPLPRPPEETVITSIPFVSRPSPLFPSSPMFPSAAGLPRGLARLLASGRGRRLLALGRDRG